MKKIIIFEDLKVPVFTKACDNINYQFNGNTERAIGWKVCRSVKIRRNSFTDFICLKLPFIPHKITKTFTIYLV